MGYRNQLAYALDEIATQDMNAAMQGNEELTGLVSIKLLSRMKNGCMGGYSDEISWDDVVDEGVVSFERVLERTEGDFYLVRIGEMNEDIETRGSFVPNPFNVGFTRMIHFDEEEEK